MPGLDFSIGASLDENQRLDAMEEIKKDHMAAIKAKGLGGKVSPFITPDPDWKVGIVKRFFYQDNRERVEVMVVKIVKGTPLPTYLVYPLEYLKPYEPAKS